MIIEWRTQRIVPFFILLAISGMFLVPGILLIVEQASRKSNDVHDEALNVVVFVGPFLFVIGILFLGLAVCLFVYTQLHRGKEPDSPVFTVEANADSPQQIDLPPYAPSVDDDQVYGNDALDILDTQPYMTNNANSLDSQFGAFPADNGDLSNGPSVFH